MDEERYEANFCLSLWAPLHTLHLGGINLSSFPSGAVLVVLPKALAILNLLLRTFGTNGDIFEESERSFPLAMWAHIGLFRGSNPLKKKGSSIRWMTTEDLTHFDFAFFPAFFHVQLSFLCIESLPFLLSSWRSIRERLILDLVNNNKEKSLLIGFVPPHLKITRCTTLM